MTTWKVFPAWQSIRMTCVARRWPSRAAWILGGSIEDFLQPDDRCLAPEPPLPVQISNREVREFRDLRVAAATHYGPAVQDKSSNEDFALSAVIKTSNGREFSFGAVADGVSTGTFWAARAARICCLVAYKAICECLNEGVDPGNQGEHKEIARRVARRLNHSFASDARALALSGAVPSGWDSSVYFKYSEDLSKWYRTTLLFGVIGSKGGVIAVSGDGGVRGLLIDEDGQNEPKEVTVLASQPERELSSYVSLTVSNGDFRLIPVTVRGRKQIHVILASDGLDETLQRYVPNESYDQGEHCRSLYRDLPLDDGTTAYNFLKRLSSADGTVPDNLSVARLSWPLPEHGSHWALWDQEDLSQWRLRPKDDREGAARAIKISRPHLFAARKVVNTIIRIGTALVGLSRHIASHACNAHNATGPYLSGRKGVGSGSGELGL
jgi:hypothetical protein